MGKEILANWREGFAFRGNYLIIQVAVKINNLHRWDVSVTEAKEIQLKLANKIVIADKDINPQLIAGVDISSPDSHGMARGAVVVLRYPELNIVEVKVAKSKVTLPYIPGLLSFRECPVILAVCEMLYNTPDIVLVDGQGIAHPRKLGLASHLGLFLDLPTIGCAKSILCGKHEPVEEKPGSFAKLIHNGQIVGAALRTKAKVKPIYVSIGHKTNLTMALNWAMKCCRGYRLPEPTRLAHLAASGKLSPEPK
ncbi:MAG: deoxyribonuclease V [Dehalococcoidia bacterium]|nr:deoxyribonuclease V [Dehalococcoidia bacterium]